MALKKTGMVCLAAAVAASTATLAFANEKTNASLNASLNDAKNWKGVWSALPSHCQKDGMQPKHWEVIDGDTFKFICWTTDPITGEEEPVFVSARLAGVGAPELRGQTNEGCKDAAENSRKQLRLLLEQGYFEIRVPEKRAKKQRDDEKPLSFEKSWNRLLVHIFRNGRDLIKELIQHEYVQIDKKYSKNHGRDWLKEPSQEPLSEHCKSN